MGFTERRRAGAMFPILLAVTLLGLAKGSALVVLSGPGCVGGTTSMDSREPIRLRPRHEPSPYGIGDCFDLRGYTGGF